MSKNKFYTPVIDRDAFTSLLGEKRSVESSDNDTGGKGTTSASAITKLWRSVIAQAFIDGMSKSSKAMLRREREKSISWLLGRSDEFYTVCNLADTDPELVRHHARRIFTDMNSNQDISKSEQPIEKKSWSFHTIPEPYCARETWLVAA